MKIEDKVRAAIRQYRLIEAGDLVLAAVSGGPDSLAMLELLHKLKNEFKYRLHVVHLNHGIRPEAVEEAEFVRRFAEERDISVTILEYDIPELLADEGGSMQEMAREVRYQLFTEVADKFDAQKIALGHHADDLAETVMMRFLRGAGLEGLVGFMAQSRARLIRPLIFLSRAEIEEYCATEGLTPCYDPSNAKPVYFRNKVRLELLPLLEKEYNPNLRHQLAQMSHLLAEENQVLEEFAKSAYDEALIKDELGVLYFATERLIEKNPALLRRILRLGMERLKGDKKNLYYQHYLQMQELVFTGSPGKMIELPDDYLLYRGYEAIRLGKRNEIITGSLGSYSLTLPGEIYLQELDVMITAEVQTGQIICSGDKASFDADLLGERVVIRSREPGDWFFPLGLVGKKKVKDYLIDEKVDRFQRDLIPIITTEAGEIVWLVGYRLDERFKVTKQTQNTCIISLSKGGKMVR